MKTRTFARVVTALRIALLLVIAVGCSRVDTSAPIGRSQLGLAGKDGARTIAAANTVVNKYTALAQNAAAAATSITVASVAALTDVNPLAPGDLVLVVQMQGATLDATNSVAWGNVTALNGAGLYELREVLSVNGATNTITLSCALKNAYSAAGATQVVRVPQYTTLTINAGASITAQAWNGTTGGIVALHASQTVTVNGSIDVTAMGFRGGATDDLSQAAGTDVTIYASNAAADGALKGEGIGGLSALYGRGAAANGGGGGNSHNGGGGGGANGRGNANAWTGQGRFDTSVTGGVLAWPLDPNYNVTPSVGGGRGGYTYSANGPNPTTTAPGNAAWGGNDRRERGGLGGRPVDNDPGSRLFIGGGGGAGDGNNGGAGRGGNGGGLVLVIAQAVNGTGQVLANGATGVAAGAAGNDGPGGAGGGGSIVISSPTITGISVQAKGGTGGNQAINMGNEAEGPGGGGGGGYVALSVAATVDVTGGPGGTTNSPAMVLFPRNGSTTGIDGQSVVGAAANAIPYCVDNTIPDTTIVTNPPNPTSSATGTFAFTSNDATATFECNVDAGAYAACTTPYTTAALADGSHTFSVRAKDIVGNVDPTPASYTWTIDTTAPDTTITGSPPDPTNTTTGTFTFTSPDGTATFECQVDAGAYAPCTSGFTTAALPDGPHTFYVRARDTVGNVDPTPASYTWVIDTTPPDTTIVTSPPDPSTSATGAFTFTSPDGTATFECQVDSGLYAACTSPFTTAALSDGPHTFSVRARDTAGNVDATPASYAWTIDTAPPDTTIVTSPPDPSSSATGTFTFTSPDGTATFECRVDAGAYAACTSPFTTAALSDGSHTFDVRAKDLAGNVDATPASYTWLVDTTIPDTTIATSPPNPSNASAGTFTFTSTETATFECSLDGGAYSVCPSSYMTPALLDGGHTLAVRARDTVGNVDPTPASYTWVIDTTPPDTTIVTSPPDPSTSATGTFTFTSPDGTATFECRVDAGAYAACTSPSTTAALSDGPHTFDVRAVDPAGNVDLTPASYTWTIDTTAPDVTIVTSPPAVSGVSTGSFTFTSSDPTATFECRIDAGAFAVCTSPFGTGSLSDGTHTFDVRAKDGAGNVSTAPASYTWIIDTTPPVDAGSDADADAESDAPVEAEAGADAEAGPDAPADVARLDAPSIDGAVLDGRAEAAADAADAARRDAGRDAAPDTGVDAAEPIPETESAGNVVVLGGGVCSYAPPQHGTGLLGLALGALLLAVLRRRKA